MLFGSAALNARIEVLERRTRQQQETINLLCERLGIDPVVADPFATLDAEETALVERGKLVEAMRHHRKRTGSSLIEAKYAVEHAGRPTP